MRRAFCCLAAAALLFGLSTTEASAHPPAFRHMPGPGYRPPVPEAPAPFAPPGVNRNFILNSGNGAGNVIHAGNYQGSFGPYPAVPGFRGVNVNVITNSGNGAGNVIQTQNGRPGFVNVNVITNSGNGVGNYIGAVNGRRR